MLVETDASTSGLRSEHKGALLTPLRRLLGETGPHPPWDDSAPIRADLFSVERLQEHARSLAAAQGVMAGDRKGAPLAKRLAENEAVLLSAYRDIAEAVDAGAVITPAAEWLIDNFHVVEKQIREIRADLPPGYYRQLPKLASGPFVGYPRVFGVAWAFVAHTDSLFDPEILRRYLRAYQEVQPLTIGELWAVAITLRIVLVENLRRIAKRIVDSRRRPTRGGCSGRPIAGRGRYRAPNHPTLCCLDTPQTTYSDAFLVQLVHRLRDQDPSIALALEWLDEQLARQGTTADAIVHDEHQRQVAVSSLTVRNIITSMRLISDVDWTELFERVSLVDDVLQGGKPISPTWISRRAISTAARSNSSPAAPASPSWRWPTRPLRRRGARTGRMLRQARRATPIPAIILIAGGPARLRSGDRISSRRRELGPGASTAR